MPFLNINLLLGEEVFATSLALTDSHNRLLPQVCSIRHYCSAELQQPLRARSKAGCQKKTRHDALGREPGLSITEVLQGMNTAKQS